MFGKLKATVAGLMVLLGFASEAEIPIDAEKKGLKLTDDQRAKLKAHFGDEYATTMVEAIDGEIKAHLDKNMDLKAIQDEIDAIVKEKDLKQKEVDASKNNGEDDESISQKLELLNKAHSDEKKKREELEAVVQKLMEEPEGDVPAAILNHIKKDMKHSGTHIFGFNQVYNAFDKRPWNARLRDGSIKATDFSAESAIPVLQGDVEHFVRENPKVINSLFNDFEDLPADWDRRTGVADRVTDATIIPGEIVQGRKAGWAPKNKFKFDAEQGRVFPKKIDITFEGHELQKYETMWISQVKEMNGSHPWKMSFIGFLLSELVKQQKADDRIAQVNGIYSINPDGTVAGDNVNSQDGLRFLWYYYRDVVKKYRAFSLGVPTTSNIVDYIEDMITRIPEEDRKNQGLEIELSDKWLKAYRKRAGEQYAHHYSTDQGKKEYTENYPIDRPNFKFQVLKDQTKTDFIGITYSKNVQVLDYDTTEKGKFTVTHEKRDTHVFADYKIGIRFKFVGTKVQVGDPKQFERQMLWSNDVPVFGPETTVPVFDDETGILKMHYTNMVIDKKWVTDITDIEGDFAPGQVVKITGNASLAGLKNLKDNSVFDLSGDYPLNTGGTIILFVNEDKTFKEISRTTTAPTVVSTDVTFTTTTIDADEGTVFRYDGATDSIDNIINGVEGKSIRIYGDDTADVVLTVATAGSIVMSSSAALASSADYVQLTLINGTWRDTKRVIA